MAMVQRDDADLVAAALAGGPKHSIRSSSATAPRSTAALWHGCVTSMTPRISLSKSSSKPSRACTHCAIPNDWQRG